MTCFGEYQKNLMIIKVKVTPNSKEERVIGFDGDILKVKIRTPPENGKANSAVIELLAKHFKVPKRCVIIQSGHTARMKHILIDTP